MITSNTHMDSLVEYCACKLSDHVNDPDMPMKCAASAVCQLSSVLLYFCDLSYKHLSFQSWFDTVQAGSCVFLAVMFVKLNAVSIFYITWRVFAQLSIPARVVGHVETGRRCSSCMYCTCMFAWTFHSLTPP